MELPPSLKVEYPFESNSLELAGTKMNYVDEGNGHPIIMLHGNPTWSFYYRNVIKQLRGQFRCIVPDHIGCGLSEKPQLYNYSLSQRIKDVQSLIDHLKIEHFHLIVHDWGGAIGSGLAIQNLSKVKKIVILNTGAFLSKNIPKRISICKLPLIGEFIVRRFNAFAYPATYMATAKGLTKNAKKGLLFPYDNWNNRIAISRFVEDIPLKKRHPSYNKLKEIDENLHLLKNNPMAIFWGMRDFCFDKSFLREWKKRFPQATSTQFEKSGHYILEDERDKINKKILDFMNKCSSTNLC